MFICFLILFSLDVFGTGLGFWETVLGLFIHNIPALILLAVLLISWKHEIVGGVAFTLFGVLYIGMTLWNVPNWLMALSWSLTIAGPALLIGILFTVGWFRKNK